MKECAGCERAASEPRYIETIPRVGYRLMVEVEAIAGERGPVEVEKLEQAVTPGPDGGEFKARIKTRRGGWAARDAGKKWVMVALAAVVISGLVGSWEWNEVEQRRRRNRGA